MRIMKKLWRYYSCDKTINQFLQADKHHAEQIDFLVLVAREILSGFPQIHVLKLEAHSSVFYPEDQDWKLFDGEYELFITVCMDTDNMNIWGQVEDYLVRIWSARSEEHDIDWTPCFFTIRDKNGH